MAGELRREAKDPGVVFLVPSNRDKPLLRELLSPDCGPSGGSSVWIWDDLYRGLAEACPPGRARAQIDPPDHWLLLRLVAARLREEQRGLPEGVRSPAFLDLAGTAVRELLREEVPQKELAASLGCSGCGSSPCPNLSDEGGLLCRIYGDYTALLDEEGLADSAQLPSLGSALLRSAPLQGGEWAKKLRLRAVGFLSFASGQLRFLKNLVDAGAHLELWVPFCGEGEFYTAADQFPEAHVVPPEPAPRPCVSIAAGDRRFAADTLARELLFWAEGQGELPGATGMDFPGWDAIAVSGDEDDLFAVMESFERYGLPFSLEEGMPFSATPLWSAALRVRDIAGEDWPSRETADLLSGLLFAPFTFSRASFAEELPSGRTGWLTFLQGFPDDSGKRAFDRALRFARVLREGATPDGLLEALKDLAPSREEWKSLLLRVEGHPGLDRQMRAVPLVVQEAGDKAKSLRDLRRDLGEAGRATLKGEEAMAFLAQWADTGTIWRDPPLTRSMAVYQGHPPTLASSPLWILLGATARQWPGQIRQSPLLDDERRKALHENPSLGLGRSHLPLVPEKRSQREALFRRLTAGGEELCILVRPLSDEKGRPLAPTPFATAAAEGEVPWLAAAAELERPLKEALPPGGKPLAMGVEIGESDGPPLGVPRGDPGAVRLPVPADSRFSLSGLDDYVSCPFRYYCRSVVRIEPLREDLYRWDLAGTAAHALWQAAWQDRTATGRPLSVIVPELFGTVVEEKYPSLAADPRLKRHLDRLFADLRSLALLQDDMDKALAPERAGQLLEEPLPEMRVDGLLFRGRADRMDILQDGRAVLFDYKSGKRKSDKVPLQLPAYALALEGEGRPVAACVYLTQGDCVVTALADEDPPPFLVPYKPKKILASMKDNALEAMRNAARSFASGYFPPNYDPRQCRRCPYPSLCRRGDYRAPVREETPDEL